MPQMLQTNDGKLHTLFDGDQFIDLVGEYLGAECEQFMRDRFVQPDRDAMLQAMCDLSDVLQQLAGSETVYRQRELAHEAMKILEGWSSC